MFQVKGVPACKALEGEIERDGPEPKAVYQCVACAVSLGPALKRACA